MELLTAGSSHGQILAVNCGQALANQFENLHVLVETQHYANALISEFEVLFRLELGEMIVVSG